MPKFNIIHTAFLAGICLFADQTMSQTGTTENRPSGPQLFLFSIGYRMPLNHGGVINSGHGVYLEGGLNVWRPPGKKAALGIYAGWAQMDRLWNTSFNPTFAHDFAQSAESSSFSGLDSAIIHSGSRLIRDLKGGGNVIPGCEMNAFHDYSLYYGLMLRLPGKYTPLIKLYTGCTRSHYQGAGNIATYPNDFNIFELRRRMYGCELIAFKGIRSLVKGKNSASPMHFGALSLYSEISDFRHSSMYFYDGNNRVTIPLKRFLSEDFFRAYRTKILWGLKLSFYI